MVDCGSTWRRRRNRNSDFSVDDRVLAFERGVVLGDYCELYSRRREKMTWGSMGAQSRQRLVSMLFLVQDEAGRVICAHRCCSDILISE
jgi:hypothetical protein